MLHVVNGLFCLPPGITVMQVISHTHGTPGPVFCVRACLSINVLLMSVVHWIVSKNCLHLFCFALVFILFCLYKKTFLSNEKRTDDVTNFSGLFISR